MDLMEKPKAILDNALRILAKKTASSFFNKFKRFLSTATEPFFRKDMGERYLDAGSLNGGAIIWAGATLVALWLPELRSAASLLFEFVGYFKLARLFGHWQSTLATGGLLVFFHMKFGRESIALMAKYRADGTAYHTQSRGIPRWEGNQVFVPIGIIVALFLFDMPVGVLFVISCFMSASLAGEQQAAIYARYLDELDKKIEQEYLENAILGKCPTEITQLHKPLAADLNSDLRKNIAAAAVGKSVRIVAKSPKRAGAGPDGGTSPDPPPPANAPDATSGEPQTAQTFTVGQSRGSRSAAAIPSQQADLNSAFQTATATAKETLANILKSKRIIRFAVVGMILLAVVAAATPVVRFIHSEMTRPAAVAASTSAQPTNPHRGNSTAPAPQARTQSQANTPVATPAPDIKSAEEKSNFEARVQAAVDALRRQDAEKAAAALEAQKREEQAKEQAALEAQKRQEAERQAALELQKQQEKERAAALELQRQQETAKVLEQVKTALADQEAQRAKLLADCETRLANNTNKIAKVATASRKTLQHNNDVLKEKIETALKTEDDSFKHIEGLLPPLAPSPQPDPRQVGIELTNYMAKVEKVRQQLTGMLADQDTDISNAPPQKGLLDFINITVH